MKRVFEFVVDEEGGINPEFELNEMTYAENVDRHVEIIGSCTSLIAINAVADFFDRNADIQYEWNFTKTEHMSPDVLIAIVTACSEGMPNAY